MVTDALVEATDKRKLHGDRQVDAAVSVALEDGLDEIDLQPVEVVVDVVERSGERRVGVGERIRREPEQLMRLTAHVRRGSW